MDMAEHGDPHSRPCSVDRHHKPLKFSERAAAHRNHVAFVKAVDSTRAFPNISNQLPEIIYIFIADPPWPPRAANNA